MYLVVKPTERDFLIYCLISFFGYTQAEVAKLLDITPSRVGMIFYKVSRRVSHYQSNLKAGNKYVKTIEKWSYASIKSTLQDLKLKFEKPIKKGEVNSKFYSMKFNINEVARILNITPDKVKTLVDTKQLGTYNNRKEKYVFTKENIMKYIKNCFKGLPSICENFIDINPDKIDWFYYTDEFDDRNDHIPQTQIDLFKKVNKILKEIDLDKIPKDYGK